MISEHNVLKQVESLLEACKMKGLTLTTAESCTGGLLAGALTEISGASEVVLGGFVTYSNDLKNKVLGVPQYMLDNYGAVSEEVAGAMAEGALEKSMASIAVSITGIAGPGGGTIEKPIGLVYIGLATIQGDTIIKKMEFGPQKRNVIREKSVESALEMLTEAVDNA